MKTILVADDNEPSRVLIREVLQARYRIVEARDGVEALDQVSETTPDLLLADIEMPGLDGFALLSRLRQNPRFASLPVVALTAYAMQGDRERALAAGFNAYITKPINAPALRREIQQLLGE
jgi:CheY-like chemotaxis protein